jgi:hypothetical protein
VVPAKASLDRVVPAAIPQLSSLRRFSDRQKVASRGKIHRKILLNKKIAGLLGAVTTLDLAYTDGLLKDDVLAHKAQRRAHLRLAAALALALALPAFVGPCVYAAAELILLQVR